jgi:hypothetical protein
MLFGHVAASKRLFKILQGNAPHVSLVHQGVPTAPVEIAGSDRSTIGIEPNGPQPGMQSASFDQLHRATSDATSLAAGMHGHVEQIYSRIARMREPVLVVEAGAMRDFG